jgi:hypothetical protein
MDTSNYYLMCDRIGQLLNDYARDNVTDRTPAFQMHRPNGDAIGRNVAAALKRWDFRALTRDGLLGALCDALEGEHELDSFRRVFQGLCEIVGTGGDE